MKNLYISLLTTAVLLITSFTSSKWISYNVDEQLSIEIPTQPLKTIRDTVEADGFEVHLKIFEVTTDLGYYRISRDDLHHESDNYLTPKGRKEWYSVGPYVEGLQQAKFLRRDVFEINGIDGVERTYELPAAGSHGHTLKYVRTLLVGKVGYEFWFIPRDGFNNPRIDQKKRFFNSINLRH
jgi:hypothetical protein